MSEYVNGVRINIGDTVRIEFVDTTQNGQTLIHSIVMNFDTFKLLRDGIIDTIEQHEAKLVKLVKVAKSN